MVYDKKECMKKIINVILNDSYTKNDKINKIKNIKNYKNNKKFTNKEAHIVYDQYTSITKKYNSSYKTNESKYIY